jgi:hypothetical protein
MGEVVDGVGSGKRARQGFSLQHLRGPPNHALLLSNPVNRHKRAQLKQSGDSRVESGAGQGRRRERAER